MFSDVPGLAKLLSTGQCLIFCYFILQPSILSWFEYPAGVEIQYFSLNCQNNFATWLSYKWIYKSQTGLMIILKVKAV